MNSIELLKDWHHDVRAMQVVHYECCKSYRQLHRRLGLASVLFTTLAGTSVFSSLTVEDSRWLVILGGVITIFAGLTSAAQTFLKYQKKSDGHKATAAALGEVRHRIEIELARHYEDGEYGSTTEFLEEIRQLWDRVEQEAPEIVSAVLNRVRSQLKPKYPNHT
ncbi:MAG: SLATT domain-containing protein [Planctomycetota bacterium]|jgi:hypothetical protein